MRVTSPKSEVASGLRIAGLWLIGFLWLGLVFGGMAVAFTPSPHSPALGWGLLAVAAIVLIATMDKWVRAFPGLLAYGAFSSIFILLEGHALNHPEVAVSRFEAVLILSFFVAAAALSFSFTRHRLTIPDRIALFVFVLCFFGQAAFPRLMLAAMAVGLASIFGAWALDSFRRGSVR